MGSVMEKPTEREIGLIFNLGAAMVKIGSLRKFVELSEKRGWNKFDACIYCARHRSRGHAFDCSLIEAKKALEPITDDIEKQKVVNELFDANPKEG